MTVQGIVGHGTEVGWNFVAAELDIEGWRDFVGIGIGEVEGKESVSVVATPDIPSSLQILTAQRKRDRKSRELDVLSTESLTARSF
jgi:hypothetical protein